MEPISKHISWHEATRSITASLLGIDNTPGEREIINMKALAENIFEPLRAWHGKPIGVRIFFRSRALNKKIHGAATNSQHTKGQAIDIDADMYHNGISNRDIFFYIYNNLNYDQLIWEHGDDDDPEWIHVSYVSKEKNRNQALRARNVNGRTSYEIFTV